MKNKLKILLIISALLSGIGAHAKTSDNPEHSTLTDSASIIKFISSKHQEFTNPNCVQEYIQNNWFIQSRILVGYKMTQIEMLRYFNKHIQKSILVFAPKMLGPNGEFESVGVDYAECIYK